jgi:hypothetical protein
MKSPSSVHTVLYVLAALALLYVFFNYGTSAGYASHKKGKGKKSYYEADIVIPKPKPKEYYMNGGSGGLSPCPACQGGYQIV